MEFSTGEIAARLPGSPALARLLAVSNDRILMRDDSGIVIHYGDVCGLARSDVFQRTRRRLVICMVNNDIGGIAGYLALLAANAVPMMVSPTLSSHAMGALIAAYRPEYLWLPQEIAGRLPSVDQYSVWGDYALVATSSGSAALELHEDLALLLSTSGSTGSSKYVRLSHQNVWSNAAAIAEYLALTADELPVTTLPPSYSYGLSVIHSHIWAGAALAVTNKTFVDRDFWRFLHEVGATSLSAVPYQYEILKKLKFTKMDLPQLRSLTQAGGGMSLDLIREYASYCHRNGKRFFAMYGQTEASPRISYVPNEYALSKAGAVGIPVPGGSIELQSDTGAALTDSNVVGELIYRGPNVCMGYAETRADLTLGDINCGILHTGDLAERDDDGYYRIVGRRKRFIKVFGNRINLQDVELQLRGAEAHVACSGRDGLLEVYVAMSCASEALKLKYAVMTNLRLAAEAVAVYQVDALPRSESGKVMYADLHPRNARRLA